MADQTVENANRANAVTGLYGLSGSGKSRQCDEACRDTAERHGLISRMVVPDLGGWGNSRQSLIDHGICEVYFPCNHVEPFATMELLSLGWWPERFIDPSTGLAEPDVAFVPPRTVQYVVVCPGGHDAITFTDASKVAAINQPCPVCQTLLTPTTIARVEREIIRTPSFARVGLRVFDSLTQLNEWGLDDRAKVGATIKVGAEDASMRSSLAIETTLPEGKFVFGINNLPHYGQLQQRSRGWIANIRAIPDQVERAILTFGVECSKGDDESGGVPVYGPKIAGNARTSSVPGWLGNCFHLMRTNEGQFQIWLRNHTDANDPRQIPYMAKHRGEPGLPGVLEDINEHGQQLPPFSRCSLRYFGELERAQLREKSSQDEALLAKLKPAVTEAVVLHRESVVAATVQAAAVAPAVLSPASGGGRTLRKAGAVRRPVPAPMAQSVAHAQPAPSDPPRGVEPGVTAPPATAAGGHPATSESAVAGNGDAAKPQKSVIQQQLEATIELTRQVTQTAPVSSAAPPRVGARPLRRVTRPPTT